MSTCLFCCIRREGKNPYNSHLHLCFRNGVATNDGLSPKNKVPDNVQKGCVPNTLFVHSESGWINAVVWLKFFSNNIQPTWPVILTLDGHSSHVSFELVKLARANNIHLLYLPSHTFHILQPLDVDLFQSKLFQNLSNVPFGKTWTSEVITTNANCITGTPNVAYIHSIKVKFPTASWQLLRLWGPRMINHQSVVPRAHRLPKGEEGMQPCTRQNSNRALEIVTFCTQSIQRSHAKLLNIVTFYFRVWISPLYERVCALHALFSLGS